jgi:AAA15 family ATPase/GTPase
MIRYVFIRDFGPFSTFKWEPHSLINAIVGENHAGKSFLQDA